MAKIDQDLLKAIADKQNIVLRAVYHQITKVVHETFLERDLAALVLAGRLRININKYSKPEQREQIRDNAVERRALVSGTGARPELLKPPYR